MGFFSWLNEFTGWYKEETEEKEINPLENRIEKLEETLEKEKQKNKKLAGHVKELTDLLEVSLSDLENDSEDLIKKEIENLRQKRNNDLKVVNKNFNHLLDKNKKLDKKFQALMEEMADRLSQEDELPNMFLEKTNLRSIFKMKNKGLAALMGNVYLMKKYFDNKGVRV